MFVTSRNLLFGVYLPRKIITILRKIAVNFRQVSLKEILPSVSVLECFGEKVGSLKILYCTWTSSQVIFKVSSRIFFYFFFFICLLFHLFTGAYTAWKVSKYGVISGPYFPAFGLNTERYEVSLRIQSESWKMRTRNSSAFGLFSGSAICVLYSTHIVYSYSYL